MYAGHAKQAAMLVGGTYQGMQKIGRLVVVVDDDIDPSNISDVLWALATRWDPATQTDIIADCSSMGSDPLITPAQRESRNFVSSRAHIYACKPYSWIDKYPPSIKSSPEVLEETARKWGKLLFGKET